MKITGWKKVLAFTYIQTVKTKSFIVSSVVMVVVLGLIIASANFLPAILNSNNETHQILDEHGNVVAEIKAFAIKKVYVFNDSGLEIDFNFLSTVGVEYELIEEGQVQSVMDKVTASNEAITLAVVDSIGFGSKRSDDITPGNERLWVNMSRPESTELIKNNDCHELLGVFVSQIENANLVDLGIDASEVHMARPLVNATVNVGGEEPKSFLGETIAVASTTVVSILLFTLIMTYGQLTAQAIATEKASRVMEMLLTSVRPLAVIVGKVLGTTLVALTSIVVVGGISTALFFLLAPFGMLGKVTGMVDVTDPVMAEVSEEFATAFSGFTALNIFYIVVIVLMGFLFYSLIAGLVGASISKIEDLQTAMQPMMYVSIVGLYLTYFPQVFGVTSPGDKGWFFVVLSRYLPISSPFALPSALLMGELSGAEALIPIAALAVTLVVFALFVAKVYEHIILQNGDRIKVKDMIKMAKGVK